MLVSFFRSLLSANIAPYLRHPWGRDKAVQNHNECESMLPFDSLSDESVPRHVNINIFKKTRVGAAISEEDVNAFYSGSNITRSGAWNEFDPSEKIEEYMAISCILDDDKLTNQMGDVSKPPETMLQAASRALKNR